MHQEDEIVYIKLFNSEDLVATIVEDTESHLVVTSPVVVKTQLNPMSQTMMSGFFPWAPFKSMMPCMFTVSKFNIVAIVELPNYIRDMYVDYITMPDQPVRDTHEFDDEDFNPTGTIH